MAISVKKFVGLIQRSGLIEADQLKRTLIDCKNAHQGQFPTDAKVVADFLCDANLLTRWQSNKLLAGKYRGFTLGKYRLLDHIATGGMSSVYLAEHTLIRQLRAIKILPRKRVNDTSYKDRFYFEAQAAAALDHPNIVRALDIDYEGEDLHYIVMEFFEGRDIQNIVRDDGPLGFETAANFTAQAAEGLHFAHEAGVIHRDVKPGNLLVTPQNLVKVLDLGLALLSDDDDTESLTLEHKENVLGTADYLAPEQARDSHKIDHRADIYGLGCTLYFMLTGHPPFPSGSLAKRILQHQKEMPSDIREDRPDCPKELVEICIKMIKKEPEDRYQTAREVADMLEAWLLGQGHVMEQRGADSSVKLAAILASQRVADARGTTSGGSSVLRRTRIRDPQAQAPETPDRQRSTDEDFADTAANQGRETVKGLESVENSDPASLGDSTADLAQAAQRLGALEALPEPPGNE